MSPRLVGSLLCRLLMKAGEEGKEWWPAVMVVDCHPDFHYCVLLLSEFLSAGTALKPSLSHFSSSTFLSPEPDAFGDALGHCYCSVGVGSLSKWLPWFHIWNWMAFIFNFSVHSCMTVLQRGWGWSAAQAILRILFTCELHSRVEKHFCHTLNPSAFSHICKLATTFMFISFSIVWWFLSPCAISIYNSTLQLCFVLLLSPPPLYMSF